MTSRCPRSWFASSALVGAALFVAGCNSPGAEDRPREAVAVSVEHADPASDAILAKWTQAGGEPVLGAATSPVTTVPGLASAQYQTFANNVAIVFTDDYGAFVLVRPVFDKWLSLGSQTTGTGENLLSYIGPPLTDSETGPGFSSAKFEKGRVDVNNSGSFATYGQIYANFALTSGIVGMPVSEETSEAGGARFQAFQDGEIHWRDDLGAHAIAGAIKTRWRALGGPSSSLGLPISDMVELFGTTGLPDLRTARFEGGAIYQSDSSGAWEMSGGLLEEYENRFGGASGKLGLPIGGESVAPVSGDHFVDFQGGVLVDHQNDINNQLKGVYAFGRLDAFFDRMQGFDPDDCGGGSADVFAYLSVESSTGGLLLDNDRFPDDGDSGGDVVTFNKHVNAGIANSGLVLTLSVNGIDGDNEPFCGSDDPLGVASFEYTIDNLWGLYAFTEHEAQHDHDSQVSTFAVNSENMDMDTNEFRASLWWNFHNFSTPELTYDQYAAAFEDVGATETKLIHPLNWFWFSVAFDTIAESGNCFGMSTESVYSQLGISPYAEPIYQYFQDTRGNGGRLEAITPRHASLINQINIKQGYQLGGNMVGWVLKRFFSGNTHDPVNTYNESLASQQAGDYPLLMLFDDYIFGRAHTVRPIEWVAGITPNCHFAAAQHPCAHINLADANFPRTTSSGADPNFVEIDSEDVFFYHSESGDIYSGSTVTGARMFWAPSSLVLGPQRTPMDSITQLIEDGVIWLVDNGAEAAQLSDDQGDTLFKEGLTAAPAKWVDLRTDAQALTDVAPIPLQADGPVPFQLYAGRNVRGKTHHLDVAPKAGMAPNAPYQVSVQSGKLSSYFTIPSTPGQPERITTESVGTTDRGISVTVPQGSVAKPITFGITGPERKRWAEFSSLGMSPAQNIRMRTGNGGFRVLIDNNGPATTAHLVVQSYTNGAPVDLGIVPIPSGSSSVDFQAPKTTLTLSNVVAGNNGWLVAPVTVTLTAQDFSGLGIDFIETSTDNVTFTRYTGPFQYSNQGVTTLYYRARDKAHNQEIAKSQSFKIDTRLPATTGTVSTSGGVRLTYQVTDPVPGSGVAGLHILQGTTSQVSRFVTAASGTVTLPTACSAVEFWGEDVAGNLTTPHVKLNDSVAPVFTFVPPTVTNSTRCTAAAGLVLGTATATDDCGPVTVTNDAPAQFPLGTTIVTWTAKDPTGNKTTRTQSVTTDIADDASCCPAGSRILRGTSNNDTLTGTSGVDCILGLGGQDTISGLGGNDVLSGGDGNDQLTGGDGNDWLSGGTGQDILRGDAGDDTLSCGDGDDQAFGGIGNDRLLGGQGQDRLMCEAGSDTADGGIGGDTLDGGSGNDVLSGGPDHDIYFGGGGVNQCVQDGGDTLNACTATAP